MACMPYWEIAALVLNGPPPLLAPYFMQLCVGVGSFEGLESTSAGSFVQWFSDASKLTN